MSVGSEFPVNLSGMGGFCALKHYLQEKTTTASRPWDVDRDGFEGAERSLEREAHARARGGTNSIRYQ